MKMDNDCSNINDEFNYNPGEIPLEILEVPLLFNGKGSLEDLETKIIYTDDKQLIISEPLYGSLAIFFFSAFHLILFFIFGLPFFILLPLLILCIYSFVNLIFFKSNEIIFNREKGEVYYLSNTFRRKKVSFIKCKFNVILSKGRTEQSYVLSLETTEKIARTILGVKTEISIVTFFWKRNFWNAEIKKMHRFASFLVWYMDKNRPLPPGKVFDPYRKEDYYRRKKRNEKPLFKSHIVIEDKEPENNKEYKRNFVKFDNKQTFINILEAWLNK